VETLDQRLAALPDVEAARMRLARLRETKVKLPEDSAGQTLLAAVLASGTYLPDLILADPERLPRLLADPWLHREKPRELFLGEVETACAGVRSLAEFQRALRRYARGEMLRLGAREIGAGIGAESLPLPEFGLTLEVARELSFFADADALTAVLAEKRAAVSAIADTLGEPTSGPPAAVLRLLGPAASNEALAGELAAAGFYDLAQSAYRLEIAAGRLPPEWLEEAIASPDPDRALARFCDLAPHASLGLFALLREERQLLRILAGLFGTSERLSRHLITHPELWPNLSHGLGDPMPDTLDWQAGFATRLAGCDDETPLRKMRRFQAEEILRIGVHDVARNLGHQHSLRKGAFTPWTRGCGHPVRRACW
jgi:glutamine synthetase adenylyltransferase